MPSSTAVASRSSTRLTPRSISAIGRTPEEYLRLRRLDFSRSTTKVVTLGPTPTTSFSTFMSPPAAVSPLVEEAALLALLAVHEHDRDELLALRLFPQLRLHLGHRLEDVRHQGALSVLQPADLLLRGLAELHDDGRHRVRHLPPRAARSRFAGSAPDPRGL